MKEAELKRYKQRGCCGYVGVGGFPLGVSKVVFLIMVTSRDPCVVFVMCHVFFRPYYRFCLLEALVLSLGY